MRVRLELPPFGVLETTVPHMGHSVPMSISLAHDALYGLDFPHVSGLEVPVCRLSAIRCLMPPLPPEADSHFGQNLDARLPMMDQYGFSATLEATQRRKEWAARGVVY